MYKERSSQVGKIMTNPRSGSGLSETTKTRIEEKFLEDKFGIKKEFWSKATDKGTTEEPISIDLMVRSLGLFGARKNDIYFENDYLTGTPDVIHNGIVYDVKTSFSGSTFPFFENEIPDKAYFYQLQSYMELTGLRSAKLVYCLVDTPQNMINDEIRRQVWKMLPDPKYRDLSESEIETIAEEKTLSQMTFDNIPEELRIRVYDVEYCPETIEKIKARIDQCREYYKELESTINNRLKSKANV
jgi:hypothetical protein